MMRVISCALLFFCQQVTANEVKVVDVKIHNNTSGKARVDVTLLHGDTGWDHYADGWDILDSNKQLIATRVLHHPHESEQPFTRSLRSVALPAGAAFIYIRGHDKVHGYGELYKVNIKK